MGILSRLLTMVSGDQRLFTMHLGMHPMSSTMDGCLHGIVPIGEHL